MLVRVVSRSCVFYDIAWESSRVDHGAECLASTCIVEEDLVLL